MSFKVSVICEDHTLDQYVCVPLIQALMSHLGKARAVVRPVTNPRLGGIKQVELQYEALATRYTAISDLVIFALDRDGLDGQDGRPNRAQTFKDRRARLAPAVAAKVATVLAVEETEVWALWGVRRQVGASWARVRAERDSKERFFEPQTIKTDIRLPGRGRKRLIEETLKSGWESVSGGCPELKELELEVRAILS